MLRLLVFVLLLFALAAGFAWLADRPGELVLNWQGYRVETNVTAAAIGLLVLFVASVFLWWLVKGIVTSPDAIGGWWGRRKREKGWRALSQGMIAVGAGDPNAARRNAGEARKILGEEPLALLLDAQASQLAGDRGGARVAFETMLKSPETRLLGLRGLYVEAQRHGEGEAARHFAEEAVKEAPALAWAGGALLEFDAKAGDWEAALTALDRNVRHKLIDKKVGKRQRAVLLTARAAELEDRDPEKAKAYALEAHGAAPELVPAAVLAARLLARGGDYRKASKLLEQCWGVEPHPEVADAYAHVRTGDSARDRLARVKELTKLRAHHPTGVLALARAAFEAHDFALARDTLKGLLTTAPTRAAFQLMAEIEDAETGDRARARDWLGRALRAPRDPAWVADGFVSDHWAPVSPVTGRLDAFEWKVPPEALAAPTADLIDDAREAFEESGTLVPLEVPPKAVIEARPVPPPPPEPAKSVAPPPPPPPPEPPKAAVAAPAAAPAMPLAAAAPVVVEAPPAPSPTARWTELVAEPESRAEPETPPAAPEPPAGPRTTELVAPAAVPSGTEPGPLVGRAAALAAMSETARAAAVANDVSRRPAIDPTPVTFPLGHAPDDPGTETTGGETEPKRKRFGLF